MRANMIKTPLKTPLLVVMIAAALGLSACSEKEEVLPGKRENLRAILSDQDENTPETIPQNRSLPVRLSAVQNNANWTQRSGTPRTRISHPAFGRSMQMIWSAPIGAGNGRRNRITADPVVSGGIVYTLDAEAGVYATATNGSPVWNRSLVPDRDAGRDASGGGLAFGNGVLFVTSGFGHVTALDGKTGAELWQQKLNATGTGSPTVMGDVVYLVAGDSTGWALDVDSGRIRWQLDATPNTNNIVGGPAPAVTDQAAIFAFGSGEIQAAFRNGGVRLWDATISGQRRGLSRSRVADITGDPVVVGDTVYVGSHSGRMVALNVATGKRIWTATEGPMSPVWVAGGSVFLVSDRNELVRLDAADGSRIWGTKLAYFVKDRPRKQKEMFNHFGPVLAGGRLIVASNDGTIRSFDPASGEQTGRVAIPGGATTNPVFAGGIMYVVGTNGQLFAFR